MVKLEKTKHSRTKPKQDFKIGKDGRVIKDKKRISKTYEKKYSHKILQTYILDRQQKVRNKKGHWVNKKQSEKYKELRKIAKERKKRQTDIKTVSVSKRKTKGRFMKGNYAHTFECTCYIEEGITTHEDDKTGHVVTHYYTISSSEHLTLGQAENRHNRHYPTHELININHSSTKVLSFD